MALWKRIEHRKKRSKCSRSSRILLPVLPVSFPCFFSLVAAAVDCWNCFHKLRFEDSLAFLKLLLFFFTFPFYLLLTIKKIFNFTNKKIESESKFRIFFYKNKNQYLLIEKKFWFDFKLFSHFGEIDIEWNSVISLFSSN